MEQETRNKLRNAVTECRRLLEQAVAQELEGTFGIYAGGRSTVHIDDEAGMTNLTQEDLSYRRDLLDHLTHIEARGLKPRQALEQLIREIAFTHLNRLCAYKMMEARQIYIGGHRFREAVSRGYDSNGVKFYLADRPDEEELFNTGKQDVAYRRFLNWLGSLLSQEIGVLFDPDDPANRLYPPQRMLDQVLELINDEELAGIWSQDETIGWVYQYFTPKELRKKAHDESSAPRNSYELAFRNQFYTPRYVVEFLTDNTLGRMWYEMRHGQTRLVQQCEYMVRWPDEVFLSINEDSRVVREGNPDARFLLGQTDEMAAFAVPETDTDDAACRLREFARMVRPFAPLVDPRNSEWPEMLTALVDGDAQGPVQGKTQDLWDCLFAVHEKDRHAPGTAIAHAHALARMANEIRRRLLGAHSEDATSEQLLNAPYLVPHRERKDPRDLKILDPACGSGHFLLYCFDLLMAIYDEAWDDEEAGNRPYTDRVSLWDQYASRDECLRDVPPMILEHNLHGIDIDVRATQIAALALWLRAHRAYHELGILGSERAPIKKGNLVCAEPMPGEAEMREEFLSGLRTDDLREVVRRVFTAMELAGEAGSLLRVEQEIDAAIRDTMPGHGGLFATDDQAQWQRLDAGLLAALRGYASRAENGRGLLRRLFAGDAVSGLAFVDTCRKRFSVVLMNPPFGACSAPSKSYVTGAYPRSKHDIYAAFVERGVGLVEKHGFIGAIVSRTGYFLTSFEAWREETMLGDVRVTAMADLGADVLDTAMVETAACCMEAR